MSECGQTSTKNEIYQLFARGPLLDLLSAANENIVNCDYEKVVEYDVNLHITGYEEYVYVLMENGCEYKICVIADSLMAMADDVIKFMMYR